MNGITDVKKPRKKQGDRVIPKFRLSRCTLKKIETIISEYSKLPTPVRPDELPLKDISQLAVKVTNSFLEDMGILSGISRKSLNPIGNELGNAITYKGTEKDIIWRKIVMENDYCIRFIRSIDQSDKVSAEDFRLNIMRIAGYLDPEKLDSQVGANALIDLFTQIGYVTVDGSKTKRYYSISNDFREDLQKRKKNNYVQDTNTFISNDFFANLKEIHHKDFDTTRLIKFCKEINENFGLQNYSSVIILCRAILDHCPPIFGYQNFESLKAQMPKSSFQKIVSRLDDSLKQIAGHHIHKQIGPKEVLPVIEEIDFKSDVNFLIGRIIERLSKGKSND